MLKEERRTTILELKALGESVRAIAKVVKASTNGAKLALVGDTVFAKYLRGMAVHWALRPDSPFSPWR